MNKPPPLDVETFEQALERLINTYSQENGSNTPDFILAQYLIACLQAWNVSVTARETWYGRTGTAPATIEQQEMLNRTAAATIEQKEQLNRGRQP